MNRIAIRLAAAFLLGQAAINETLGYGTAEVNDVRVKPMVASRWSVGDFGGEYAFNLYTPKNYSCGCGITAFLQVMRYWCAPRAWVAPKSFPCWLEGNPVTYATKGGEYDWDAMPFTEEECTTPEQREALGRIAFDLGVASHVSWANVKYSYSYGLFSAEALLNYYRYASARTYMGSINRISLLKDDAYKNALLASLDAGMPAVLGIRTPGNQGHQVVVDGYGFDTAGNLFCHLNFGWKGAADAWYSLIGNSFLAGDGIDEFEFFQIDEIAYNIDPEVAGDVVSGRVLDASGNPVANATVSFGLSGKAASATMTTGENGIFSFRFKEKGKYVITADEASLGHAERTVNIAKTGMNVALDTALNFSVAFTSFALYASSFGTVANLWGQDLTLKSGGTPTPTPTPTGDPLFTAAATLDGYLTAKDGSMAGTISLKAGKAGKTGESKMTATVMLAGQTKKYAFKGTMLANGAATLSCNGLPNMELVFDAKTMSGTIGISYVVFGMRNLFTSKNKAEAKDANDTLTPWLGALNISWDAGYLTATVAAKGKVKISGMIDGKKASATSQLLLGETDHVIPVLVTAKPNSLALLLTLAADGSIGVTGLDGCKAGKVLGLPVRGATFQMDTTAAMWSKLPGTVLTAQLPDGLQVDAPGGKWSFPKAGKVVYIKGTTEVDPEKAGKNPSGLKISYKAKDGSFKGSFKAYADNGGKLKATAVTVTGVLVGNVGYGTASIKNVGSVSVVIGE